MRAVFFAFAAAAAIIAANATPVQAQQQQKYMQTWVASTGNDTVNGPCSRVAPCKTFSQAADLTAQGGEIIVLDSGEYGPVIITKPLSILAVGVQAHVTVKLDRAGVNIDLVDFNAPSVVTLDGLTIEGNGSGHYGIGIAGDNRTVIIRNCTINGFNANPDWAAIISEQQYVPTVYVSGSRLTDNSTAIKMLGRGTFYIDDDKIIGNTTGIDAGPAGKIVSFGNNTFAINGKDGRPNSRIKPQ